MEDVERCQRDDEPAESKEETGHLETTVELEPEGVGAVAEEMGGDDAEGEEETPANKHQ